MGPITGLATVVTILLVTIALLGLVVVGLTVGVVLPAVAASRADRRRRHLGIAEYHRLAAAH